MALSGHEWLSLGLIVTLAPCTSCIHLGEPQALLTCRTGNLSELGSISVPIKRRWKRFEHIKVVWWVSLGFRNYFAYRLEWEMGGLTIKHSWTVFFWKGFIPLCKFHITCLALSSGSRFVLIERCQGNNACGFSRYFRSDWRALSICWWSYLGIRERPYVNLFLIKITLISITHVNLAGKQ